MQKYTNLNICWFSLGLREYKLFRSPRSATQSVEEPRQTHSLSLSHTHTYCSCFSFHCCCVYFTFQLPLSSSAPFLVVPLCSSTHSATILTLWLATYCTLAPTSFSFTAAVSVCLSVCPSSSLFVCCAVFCCVVLAPK